MIDEKQALILERVLREDFYFSPLKFAMWAYNWGEGDLRKHNGPRKWQRDIMLEIEKYLREGKSLETALGILPEYFRKAVVSGRGIGKSALLGMLSHWFMSTRIGSSTWIAANGKPQLEGKTFPEIAKWFVRAVNAEFFEVTGTSVKPATWFAKYIESEEGLGKSSAYYYCKGVLWSEENPDAFAGAHNYDGELCIFDEASGIPDCIWTVQEGVFTEDIIDRLWLAFSNGRRREGQFFECFHKDMHQWSRTQIDGRTVEGISHAPYNALIAKHGEDSNEVAIEVKGLFPTDTDDQFIPYDIIQGAMLRQVEYDSGAPLLMGVDVARKGKDRTVISFRRGRDGRSIAPKVYRGIDTQETARHVANLAAQYHVDAIFVDGGGVGGGVVDALKAMGIKCIEVQAGASADNSKVYRNKRAELWGLGKEWLRTGAIRENEDLRREIESAKHKYHPMTNQLMFEPKEEMPISPDEFESLLQTFAKPIARVDAPYGRQTRGKVTIAKDVDETLLG